MVTFIFTENAKKTFLNLPKKNQERIIEKLKSLKIHENIFSVLKRLYEFEPATHRLRVGNYRLILELKNHQASEITLYILKVGHRKDIYR